MAYQTGTATGPGDLLSKLATFAVANGWVQDLAPNGSIAAIHRNNVYVSFWYNASVIKIYPARGFTAASPPTSPGDHPGSAYNDTLTATTSGMIANQMAGPYAAYYFFESDTYLHVVINTSNGIIRHFGFGEISKSGTYTGGEYCFAHYWNQTGGVIDSYTSNGHLLPFDGTAYNAITLKGFTLYAQTSASPPAALPGQTAGTKWYTHSTGANTDGDGAAVGYLEMSGVRGGYNQELLALGASALNGFTPLCPIYVTRVLTAPAPDEHHLMGTVPDVRCVNVVGATTAQEVVIGSDPWVFFPVGRKGSAGVSGQEYTRNFGYAYRKIVA